MAEKGNGGKRRLCKERPKNGRMGRELAKRGREKMERWRGEKVSQLNSHRAMYKERRRGGKKERPRALC